MTPEQVELARHALGLPNNRRKSYRNHFVAGPGHSDYDSWQAMVAAGHAGRTPGSQLTGGDDCFWLNLEGAKMALRPGERLSPEDFPQKAG